MKKRLLAFDFGASSGRAMLGEFDGERIALTEVHRFDNNPVTVRGTFYWDVLALFHEIKQGITKAKALGDFESIGIDTWGVDFGLLDRHGDLMQNPVHYRDARTAGMIEEVCGIIGRDELYRATGNQFMELNTIFQLYSLAQKRPELLERASRALLMPDLFGYLLTGGQASEYSIASTTQLMDPRTHEWNKGIMRRLGDPRGPLPRHREAGHPAGRPVGRHPRGAGRRTGEGGLGDGSRHRLRGRGRARDGGGFHLHLLRHLVSLRHRASGARSSGRRACVTTSPTRAATGTRCGSSKTSSASG